MATTLQEKFALLQQMKKEKELKDAKAKDTKKFDIFSIAGVALPGASGTTGPRNSTEQGPGGVKAGGGITRRPSTSRQNPLDTTTKPPTASVSRTSSSTSLKRGHSETASSSAPESVPENDEPATAATTTTTTTTTSVSGKNPQLLSPIRSPPGVDHERVTSETDKSAGAQECPPKKLKRSSMAVRNERQALERRTSSSSGNMDHAPEQANRLGSPTRDNRGVYPRTDRKYSTDYTDSPGGDSSSVSSMPLTPTPSPLHVEDYNSRTSKDGGAYRPDIVDIRESGYGHHNNPMATEAHLRGRYHHHQNAMAYNSKAGGYDCGSQSPARSGSLSPSRSRSRSPMVMSPPHRKPSFSMSMSPPHTTQSAPRPPKVATLPRVIHQLPPRPRSPKLPPEMDVAGRTVSARVVTGALVSPQSLDPRAAAASARNVRRQILSYDDL